MALPSYTMRLLAALIMGHLALQAQADCLKGVMPEPEFDKIKFFESFPYVVTAARNGSYPGCTVLGANLTEDGGAFNFSRYNSTIIACEGKGPLGSTVQNITGNATWYGKSVFTPDSGEPFNTTVIVADMKTFYVSYTCVNGTPATVLNTQEGRWTEEMEDTLVKKSEKFPTELKELVDSMKEVEVGCEELEDEIFELNDDEEDEADEESMPDSSEEDNEDFESTEDADEEGTENSDEEEQSSDDYGFEEDEETDDDSSEETIVPVKEWEFRKV